MLCIGDLGDDTELRCISEKTQNYHSFAKLPFCI